MYKILSMFLLCFASVVNAQYFPDKYLLDNFSSRTDFSKIQELNKKVTATSFLICASESTLDCFKSANGKEFVLFLSERRVQRINYRYDDELRSFTVFSSSDLRDFESAFMDNVLESLFLAQESIKIEINHHDEQGGMNFNFKGNEIRSSGIYPNGCGTPASETYDYIPDQPFKEACDGHDICYTSTTLKSVCDNLFNDYMRNIVERYNSNFFHPDESIELAAYALLVAMKEAYYSAVKFSDTALQAYCENKANVEGCLTSGGEWTGFESMPNFEGPAEETFYKGSPGGFPESTLGSGSGGVGGGCYITEYGSVCTGGGCTYWVHKKPCG